MNVFLLRITVDDQDNFIREVQIKANQTFKVLHDFIVKQLKLDTKELASFHVADENWRKLLEISLIDMTGKRSGKAPKGEKLPVIHLMEKTKLESFLFEIGQKIVYEYDFLQMHTFLIEVVDIDVADDTKAYPNLSYTSGRLMLRDKLVIEQDSERLKQELLAEFNLMMKNDEDDDDDDYDLKEDDY
jgi:hypothetical protein